jgi:hypothetical protein
MGLYSKGFGPVVFLTRKKIAGTGMSKDTEIRSVESWAWSGYLYARLIM